MRKHCTDCRDDACAYLVDGCRELFQRFYRYVSGSRRLIASVYDERMKIEVAS